LVFHAWFHFTFYHDVQNTENILILVSVCCNTMNLFHHVSSQTFSTYEGEVFCLSCVQANLLDKYSAHALATWAQSHRYSGLLFWSYHGVDDKGKWVDFCDCWAEEAQK
jgi:hypothetical protein